MCGSGGRAVAVAWGHGTGDGSCPDKGNKQDEMCISLSPEEGPGGRWRGRRGQQVRVLGQGQDVEGGSGQN